MNTDRKKAKEIADLRKSFPEDYKSSLNKIINYFYQQGVKDAYGLMAEVLEVPPNQITDYCVVHEDAIDGG